MKSDKEILKQAKELCRYDNNECAIYLSGYLKGYKTGYKEYELENKKDNTMGS